ncbi:M24 family metallopeptidase [Nakamurella endophytica]|uniref:Dipeptidase n=1 Tax=Nakamurella endophytica TaxID=1748367 RepID=A0A917SRH9_9ACTN|nr:Xaa-Pro peptidase family protein [Nakamurella endophytica]GGL91319.1 dipeptidase [Nakamurella endophytica]
MATPAAASADSSTPGADPTPAPSRDGRTAAAADRLARLAEQAALAGADAVLVSPGADLAYLAGHSVGSHERFTVLLVPATGAPHLLVPLLERPGWDGTPVVDLGVTTLTWADGQDPYRVLADLLPADSRVLAVDDHMPAVHALGVRAAVPGSELTLAGPAIAELRMRKEPAEVDGLLAIGAAVDRVHEAVGQWLRPGRTERDVAADIAAALVAEGHRTADFVIVGSGPNGASPHHEASDREIRPGELVVIDIGGPGPDGYFSDCTRTYQVVGEPVDAEQRAVHDLVRRAQRAAVEAVRPGVTAQDVDRAARTVIAEAGLGERFITRTGHGIGLEVHEHPYIVEGNERPLEPGMAFSIEPGVYLPGRFGVRIEDIVVVGEDGAIPANRAGTEYRVVGG